MRRYSPSCYILLLHLKFSAVLQYNFINSHLATSSVVATDLVSFRAINLMVEKRQVGDLETEAAFIRALLTKLPMNVS